MDSGELTLSEDWWGGRPESNIVWRFKDSAFTSSGFTHRHLLTLLPMVYKDAGDAVNLVMHWSDCPDEKDFISAIKVAERVSGYTALGYAT